MSSPEVYEFGPFLVDARKRILLREGRIVPLPPKAFDTLLVLLRYGGQVLDKEELIHAVWPDVIVEESNLAVNIWALRKALGDTLAEHRYIVTVPGQGYSFVADVVQVEEGGSEGAGLGATVHPRVQADTPALSMAVLPFTVLGSEGGDESLGIGLADSLITRLSRVRPVVRAASAVAKYRGSGADPILAGRKLGVGAVLCGTIRRGSTRLRVTAQLVRVRDGVALWADTLDETARDLFTVEDAISERVVEALMPSLSGDRPQRLKRYLEDSEAYEPYLKGRYCWNKRTQEGCTKGIKYFEQAIANDPNYPLAYAGLADCYIFLGLYSVIPPNDCFPKATAMAIKALDIEDRLAEAHTSLAYAKLLYEWDFPGADEAFRRALGLNSHYATAHSWHSDYFLSRGQFDQAMASMERAQELDPLSLMIDANIGEIYFFARRYQQASEHLLKTISLDRYFATAHYNIGLAHSQLGNYQDAVSELQTALSLSEEDPIIISALGHVYGISDRRDQAYGVIRELERLSLKRYVSPYTMALVYTGLREQSEALRHLEQAYDERSPWLTFLGVEPRFDELRTNSRFTDLVQRIGPARP